ncbi:flagellar hook-length control protein FliK [Propionivibrio dicarboxylicus]|uniref:Flagellar hook-length control protein FliK n=1 Tax=Propionivibrio dicarboxylicus TaxID=83767 RepID=A0A1G8HD24_9RHOO|nr:flagellar hook-length control protein FliK [Propionivibrio dicarboxylicus]SDI04556.1 flagellar hook-length control protein FliK [Propionivibrio dicarboxylicus]
MAITVISALPKSAPVANANADTSAGSTEGSDAAANQDFLSLLLGLGFQTGSTGQSMTLESIDTQDDTSAQATDSDTAAQDGLLAALGLVNASIPTITLNDIASRKSGTAANDSSALMAGIGKGQPQAENLTTASTTELNSDTGQANLMASLRAKTLDAQDDAAKIADDTTATKEAGTMTGAFSDALNRVGTSNTSATDASRSSELSVRTPVKSNDWHQAFSDKIVWMASNEKQSARITLNPEQMGPIEVSLNIDKGSATATFVSANSDVRDSIETALPRLREMFAGIGIELGQANVSSESFQQPTSNGEEYSNRSQERNGNGILTAGTTTVSAAGASSGAYAKQQGIGLVDIFA